jgi:hypothetical protein
MTSFSSEQDAYDFLAKGIDNVPQDMQQIYAALQFRKEQAEI